MRNLKLFSDSRRCIIDVLINKMWLFCIFRSPDTVIGKSKDKLVVLQFFFLEFPSYFSKYIRVVKEEVIPSREKIVLEENHSSVVRLFLRSQINGCKINSQCWTWEFLRDISKNGDTTMNRTQIVGKRRMFWW